MGSRAFRPVNGEIDMAKTTVSAATRAALNIPAGDYAAFGAHCADVADKSAAQASARAEWLRASLGKAPTDAAIETARIAARIGYCTRWAKSPRSTEIEGVTHALPVKDMAKTLALETTKGVPILVRAMLDIAGNGARVAWLRDMDRAFPERAKARAAARAAKAAKGGKVAGRPAKGAKGAKAAKAAKTEGAPAAQGVPTIPMVCETLREMWATFTTEERTKLVEQVNQTFRVLGTQARAGKAQKADKAA